MTAIIAATVAALASIIVAYIQVKDRSKIRDIYRETNENSHKNESPTLKDLLDEVITNQKDTHDLIVRHIAWHLEKE